FYVIVVLFSSPILAIPSGRTELTYPFLETLRSGEKILTLRTFGNDIELKLEPAGDVIADDFTVMDGNGKIHKTDVKNLKSKLFRNKEKDAALYINEEGPLKIKGMLTSKLGIEPYESQDTVRDGIKAHRITEILVETKRFNDAVFNSNLTVFSDYKAREFNADQCVVIEYLFVTDSTVTNRYENVEILETYLASMFVEVQNIMDTLNLNMKVRLIGVKTYTDESEPYFVKASLFPGIDIFEKNVIINKFKNYYCKRQYDSFVNRADIILFITRRVIGEKNNVGWIFDNLLGLSYFGGTCDPCRKYGAIVDLDKLSDTASIVAHESAHLIGSPHDGAGVNLSLPGSPEADKCPGSDGFFMGSDSGKNRRKFSTCSLENIKFFLNKKEARCIITDCKKTL
ncbi:venom metalloproteinase antarease-like TserMP_B, partial [Centruroides sculpturatus]|uniref:venom metalloproteinase antarease-like TserMP_B n=1 Tax=Centruroides sculpturatus TaxID=218467 RepID=UPI000C6E077A